MVRPPFSVRRLNERQTYSYESNLPHPAEIDCAGVVVCSGDCIREELPFLLYAGGGIEPALRSGAAQRNPDPDDSPVLPVSGDHGADLPASKLLPPRGAAMDS